MTQKLIARPFGEADLWHKLWFYPLDAVKDSTGSFRLLCLIKRASHCSNLPRSDNRKSNKRAGSLLKSNMRTLLVGCALLVSVSPVFAQGTLLFGNEFRNELGVLFFRAPVYGPDPNDPSRSTVGPSDLGTTTYAGPLLQGTGYTMALFAGPEGVADPSTLLLVATTTFRTASRADLWQWRQVLRPNSRPGPF
jgi:hypothetical protein